MGYRMLLFFGLFLELAGQASGAATQTWYVSPAENAHNPGTRHQPFATPARALETSRQPPRADSRRILLDTGQYFDVALRLGPEDSGLTIAAAPGAKPMLLGGQKLTGFQPDGPNLWAATLPAGVSADFHLL